ncbi:MAG: MTH1187 family thiamine-binding protein [Candidatus Aminicenantes bacterium]|nr:MTH1187 family thiamine-binding protein [Candidatus Aminicenantes bacterium]
MIIASLAIFPTSEGASVSKYVKEVIQIIEGSGLKSDTGGMSTTIEAPDLQSLFKVIEKCHDKLIDMKAQRIHVDLHIDHRLDKKSSVQKKLKSVGKA